MTQYVDIPLMSYPYYELSISLEGRSYIIEFIYNERSQLYYMNFYDDNRSPIVLGQALIPEYPIFLDYPLSNLTGYFWLLNNSTLSSEPHKTYPEDVSRYYSFVYIIP